MADRKVLNRFIPWDFDPSKIQKIKRTQNNLTTVRNMLPMSVSCSTCGEFMYKGTKFNTKMERLEENYLGIQIYRFYYKCTACNSIYSIKTDPQNATYYVEFGANTNFEHWREARQAEAEEEKLKKESENDNMKSLEDRTLKSKLEMDIHDALDEVKAQNARREHGRDKVLDEYLSKSNEPVKLTKEEEERIQLLFMSAQDLEIPEEKVQEEKTEISINTETKENQEYNADISNFVVKKKKRAKVDGERKTKKNKLIDY